MTGTRDSTDNRLSQKRTTAGELLGVLRALRHDATDEPGKALELGPAVAGSLVAALATLRWGAVMIGLAWTATGGTTITFPIVVALTIAIFLASWRTMRPLRLGDRRGWQLWYAFVDVVLLSGAIGYNSGLTSAFVGTVFVSVAIVAFGWGLYEGMWAATISLGVTVAVAAVFEGSFSTPIAIGVLALAAAAVFPGLAHERLLLLEGRRLVQAERIGRLAETNQVLGVLNHLTRTLPSSLDLEEVLATTRQQLRDTFAADRIILLTYEDGSWSPQIQEGFNLPPLLDSRHLPSPLIEAAARSTTLRISDLSVVSPRAGSGIYVRLMVDGIDTGLIGIERANRAEPFNQTDSDLLTGMADVLALTVSNARAFKRLRSLAAAEERTRIARDLHDRLGQYLTYIGLELERINSEQAEPSMDLKQLHEDTQGAIAELRDTLIELRASVTTERPLSTLLVEVVDRFEKRSRIDVTLIVPEERSDRLSAVVENELLRIVQEALTNVEKHAMATHAHIGWSVEAGRGVLVIQDNGRGFDPSQGIRGTAYGLVGMRERAASVGAILEVTSEPDQGTVVTVLTSQPVREVK